MDQIQRLRAMLLAPLVKAQLPGCARLDSRWRLSSRDQFCS